MRSKDQKQTKLRKICKAPIKILCKARDFYVKGMNELAAGPSARLPKSSCSVRSSFKSRNDDDEDFRQLIRAASARVAEGSKLLQPNGVARSYSVSVGKIGMIEEDKPCDFEVYSTSRSRGVKRNYVNQV